MRYIQQFSDICRNWSVLKSSQNLYEPINGDNQFTQMQSQNSQSSQLLNGSIVAADGQYESMKDFFTNLKN